MPIMPVMPNEAALTASSRSGDMSLLIELVVPDSPTSEAIGPPMLVVTMMSVPLHTISLSMLIMSMYDIMDLLYIDCDSRSTIITDSISIDTLIPELGS